MSSDNSPKKSKLWIYDFSQLFDNLHILPYHDTNLSNKLNSVARIGIIILVVFIILNLFDMIIIPLMIIIFSVLLYHIYENQEEFTPTIKKENMEKLKLHDLHTNNTIKLENYPKVNQEPIIEEPIELSHLQQFMQDLKDPNQYGTYIWKNMIPENIIDNLYNARDMNKFAEWLLQYNKHPDDIVPNKSQSNIPQPKLFYPTGSY